MSQKNKNSELGLFIILTSLFIAALVTCNLIANKFVTIDLGFKTFIVSAGILPYPITFLITDILSEIYGRKMTNRVVMSGFFASIMVLLFLWLGSLPSALPDKISFQVDYNQNTNEKIESLKNDIKDFAGLTIVNEKNIFDKQDLTKTVGIELEFEFDRFNFTDKDFEEFKFILKSKELVNEDILDDIKKIFGTPVNNKMYDSVFQNAWRVMAASMIAYLSAQFLDVKLFHFWKNLTRGKHLWLRNNASTVGSQLVDTTLVICVLFVGEWSTAAIIQAIIDGWTFKMLCAFIDTPIFYWSSSYLKRKFNLKLNEEVVL